MRPVIFLSKVRDRQAAVVLRVDDAFLTHPSTKAVACGVLVWCVYPTGFLCQAGASVSKSEFSQGLPGLVWSASPAFNRRLDQKSGRLPGVQLSAFSEVLQAMLRPGEPG